MLTLVDSGAEQNLISKDLVEQLLITVKELTQPFTAAALTGQTIASIAHRTSYPSSLETTMRMVSSMSDSPTPPPPSHSGFSLTEKQKIL